MSSLLLRRVVSSAMNNFQSSARCLLGVQDGCKTQYAGLKVKNMLKLRCKYCYFVRIDGRMYVKCNKQPRHNAMEPFNFKLLW